MMYKNADENAMRTQLDLDAAREQYQALNDVGILYKNSGIGGRTTPIKNFDFLRRKMTPLGVVSCRRKTTQERQQNC